MKRLYALSLASAIVCGSCSAQWMDPDTSCHEVRAYVGASLSTSTGDGLGRVSYPTVEAGLLVDGEWSLGMCLGRRDLAARSEKERAEDYFAEAKVYAYRPFGKATKGFLLFGAGTFFNTDTYFVEYGGGVCWPAGPVDLSVQYSNWAATNYVSVGLSKTF